MPNIQYNYADLLDRPVRSILIVKLRAIGDVLLSTVVTENLRLAFPEARIDFLTEGASSAIIRTNPYIDECIVTRPGKDSSLRTFFMLARKKYDLVIDLFCNPRSAQMTFATRAPIRVGYPFRGRAWAYNMHVAQAETEEHNVDFNLRPLRQLGIPVSRTTPIMPLPEEDTLWAAEYVASIRRPGSPLVALNPSGTWETKRWGLEHFANLADRLIETENAQCLLLWGPGELPDVERIGEAMRHRAEVPPPSTLTQLGALLALCDYTISNDAGPMHISAAVGTPTLGIFGPTNPTMQGPYSSSSSWVRMDDLDCIACNLIKCSIGNVCMKDLAVDHVINAFHELKRKDR